MTVKTMVATMQPPILPPLVFTLHAIGNLMHLSFRFRNSYRKIWLGTVYFENVDVAI